MPGSERCSLTAVRAPFNKKLYRKQLQVFPTLTALFSNQAKVWILFIYDQKFIKKTFAVAVDQPLRRIKTKLCEHLNQIEFLCFFHGTSLVSRERVRAMGVPASVRFKFVLN